MWSILSILTILTMIRKLQRLLLLVVVVVVVGVVVMVMVMVVVVVVVVMAAAAAAAAAAKSATTLAKPIRGAGRRQLASTNIDGCRRRVVVAWPPTETSMRFSSSEGSLTLRLSPIENDRGARVFCFSDFVVAVDLIDFYRSAESTPHARVRAMCLGDNGVVCCYSLF
jgi:hypothetical protein